MRRIFFALFALALVMPFLLGAPILDMLGWTFSNDSGAILTRIHPSTYVLLVALIGACIVAPYRVLNAVRRPLMLLFLFAIGCLFVKAIRLVMTGVTGGELTLVITNFLTPALIVICASLITPVEYRRFGVLLRGFFIVDSLMALAERAIGHRFIPNTILDAWHEPRSAAFFGHPLNGSLLTGLMIIYLLTARRDRLPVWVRIAELLLHAGAMFAFGGRSALVFTPLILLMSAIIGRNRAGEVKLTLFQRATPIAVPLIGAMLTLLPLDFIDQTLDRFTNDNGSAQTRNSAMQMVYSLPWRELMSGLDMGERMAISRFYNTQQGIELSWIALTLDFGLIAILPMMIAFPLFLISNARPLDRSAMYMVIFFLLVTFGSLSIGTKSLLVEQLTFMMFALSQPRFSSAGRFLQDSLNEAARAAEPSGRAPIRK